MDVDECYNLLHRMKEGWLNNPDIFVKKIDKQEFVISRKRLYRQYLAPSFRGSIIQNEIGTVIRGNIKTGISILTELGMVSMTLSLIITLLDLFDGFINMTSYYILLPVILLLTSLLLIWFGNKKAKDDVDSLIKSIEILFLTKREPS